jgi:hypothetical protein
MILLSVAFVAHAGDGRPGVLEGKFSGAVPESMKVVDALKGVKEGTGKISDTLYVIFDPRCSSCRALYNSSRDYVKKGATIKWIPVVALGDPENGEQLAATILQSNDQDAIRRVLGNHEPIKTKPTQATKATLNKNLDFMFDAYEQSGGMAPGVPVAFYVNHRTGKPAMMINITAEDIWGKP